MSGDMAQDAIERGLDEWTTHGKRSPARDYFCTPQETHVLVEISEPEQFWTPPIQKVKYNGDCHYE